jgi:hypothetical protein
MDDFEKDLVGLETDDWDDVDLSDVEYSDEDDLFDDEETDDAADGDQTEDADQAEDTDEIEDTAETEGESKTDKPEGADGSETEPDGKAKDDQTFELKYMGEVKTVSREEAIALAQKGMDYDRVKSKYEALANVKAELEALTAEKAKSDEVVEFVAELAREQGLNISAFIDQTRASLIAQKEGIDLKTALERVRLNRERAELEKAKSQKTVENREEQKRREEIQEFVSAYPQIDPSKIPQEVWEQVAKGERLLTAYRNYEVAQENASLKQKIAELERTIEAERKNKENKAKSTGTRSSAGSAPKKDKWFVGWDDD